MTGKLTDALKTSKFSLPQLETLKDQRSFATKPHFYSQLFEVR